VHYTARRKLGLLTAAERLQHEEGMSIRNAAEELLVAHSLLVKWKKQQSAEGGACPIIAMIKSKKKAAHGGLLGQLKSIEQDLLRTLFELREQGVEVNTLLVVMKASSFSPEFKAKSFTACCSTVRRFMRAHSFVYRMGTHKTQHKPEEVEGEVKDYMRLIGPFVIGSHRDPRFILNMDQTPVCFLMNSKRTYELIGKKTIHIRTSTNDTKRATVAVTIAGDGTVLPSVVAFKGKANGRIAKKEFSTFPASHHYHCQDAAWMDKTVMLAWVDQVLQPYVNTAPEDIIPILILDSYRCHMMASVVQKIQELGVEVKHIPGGCTSLCQPVDIGFNKPFKNHIWRLWTEWMISEGIANGTTSTPTRLNVATWVDQAMADMSAKHGIVRNAWLKSGYEWFDKNEGVVVEEEGLFQL
jgi:hypothetical protein